MCKFRPDASVHSNSLYLVTKKQWAHDFGAHRVLII